MEPDAVMPDRNPMNKRSNIPLHTEYVPFNGGTDDGFSKIYTKPSRVYEKLYQSYEKIVEAVENWFRSGLSTSYAAFDSAIKAKQSNNETFIKTVFNYDLYDNSDPNTFMKTLALKISEHDLNICGNINHDAMDENAHDLENKLASLAFDQHELLNYKVENSYEIRPDYKLNEKLIENTLIFKIRPVLKCIVNSGLYKDLSNLIPICKYDVLFDYNSICNFTIYNATYPKDVEEIIDRETFIENNMSNFKSIMNDIARKIILEIFDRINDVNNNFDKFNSKSAVLTRSILKSDLNNGIISKMKYLCRSTLSEELPGDSKDFNDLFNKIDDRVTFESIYENYKIHKLGFDSLKYKGDIIESILNNNNNRNLSLQESIDNLCNIYYGFAFSHFFEDEVLYEYCYGCIVVNDENNMIDSIKAYKYTREFDKKYNFNELMNITMKIDDYNLRDFYQVIIKEAYKNSSFALMENYKCENGERETFLVSKAKRCVSVYLLGFMISIKRLMNYYSLLESKKIKPCNVNLDLCNKLYSSFTEYIRDYIEILVNFTSDAILDSIASYPYCNNCTLEKYPKLSYMLKLLFKHISLISETRKRGNVPYLDNLGKFFKIDDEYHLHGRYEERKEVRKMIRKSFEFITDNIYIDF